MRISKRSLLGSLVVVSALVPSMASAQAGREGARTILLGDTVINRYTRLTAAANPGATTLSVTAVSALSSTAYTSNALSEGDLVFVYQPQGATIDTTDSANYGAVTALGNAGNWQFVRVGAVNTGTNTITLDTTAHPTGLAVAFSTGAQVIRVPQFTNLTIALGASIVAQPWDGQTGGVVVIAADGQIAIGATGMIHANGRGFRGGATENNSDAPGTGVTTYRSAMGTAGAEKGESIAGTAAVYDTLNGRYGRGAPANGGGGGDSHNAGGGGGANGGVITAYNGAGIMTAPSMNFANAWALDPDYMANGNMLTNSSGGGRGGYTYSASNENATTRAPGATQWGGDSRRQVGGRGGRPLGSDYTRLFFGGGGGAGDGNNGGAGAGGNGGGLVFLVTRSIIGPGNVEASGAAGERTGGSGNDAPGGAGGGGSVVISTAAPLTGGLDIFARGGVGGSQFIGGDEAEGPGGGGGGGVVHLIPGSTIAVSASGGASGTSNSDGVTEFNVNGATGGAPGVVSTSLTVCALFPGYCPVDTSTFVMVSAPTNGSFIPTRTPTVTGTGEPGSTITVTVNGMSVMTTVSATGTWSVMVPAGAITMDGPVTISVGARDTGGNTANANVMVTVDTVAPTLVITAPTAGARVATRTPTISGTSEPNSTVTLDFGGGRTATVMTDAMGNWSYSVPAGMPLSEGPVTVTAQSTDRAGNRSPTRTVMFTVDTVTNVTITSPMTGSTIGTRTPMVTGTTEPGNTVTITVNGMSVMTTADAMGMYSATVPMGAIPMDGPVTITVTARDAGGNMATATTMVTVDSSVVVTITSPAMGSRVASRTPTIRGTARPNATVTLDLGGGRTAMVMADAMGNWSYTVPAGMEFMDGAMVTATATSAGPGGPQTATTSFTIDVSTTVTITSPMAGAMTGARPMISGTAEPGAVVTITLDNGEVGMATADAMGNWSYTPTMPLNNGTNTIRVVSRDSAGNTAMGQVVVTVSGGTTGDGGATDGGADASADGGAGDGGTGMDGSMSGDGGTGEDGAMSGDGGTGEDGAMSGDGASSGDGSMNGDGASSGDGATNADSGRTDGSANGDGSSAGDGGAFSGFLSGDGACACTVVASPTHSSSNRAMTALALACAVSLTCASRSKRRAQRRG